MLASIFALHPNTYTQPMQPCFHVLLERRLTFPSSSSFAVTVSRLENDFSGEASESPPPPPAILSKSYVMSEMLKPYVLPVAAVLTDGSGHFPSPLEK